MFIKERENMNYVLELQEIANVLDDEKQKLLLEVARNFLSDDDWADILTEEDLKDIAIAEQELANGETINHKDRKWK